VRIAIRLGMAGLAWVAGLVCHQTFAQQLYPFGREALYASREAETMEVPSVAAERTFDLPASDPRRAFFADGEVPVVGAGPTGPAPCCEICGHGASCPRLWSVSQGVRIFHRSRPRRGVITNELDAATATARTVMVNRNVGFDPAAGYYTTIGRYLGRDAENRDRRLEFTYWGLTRWENMDERTGERLTAFGVTFGSLFSPFEPTQAIFDTPVGGFNRADRHVIENNSELHSFELAVRLTPRTRQDRLVMLPNGTWRRECNPGQYFSYTFGPRYLILDERFNFTSEGTIQQFGEMDQLVTGRYHVHARNHLLGLQVGAETIFRQCRSSWGFQAKVGPYLNFAGQTSTIRTNASADPFAGDDLDILRQGEQEVAAVVGQVGAVGTYQVRPNLRVRGAWDLMWIAGLSLAPEQVVFNTGSAPHVNANGMLFLQGLTLEMELVW
jgi:hypothetical protein